MTEALKFCSFCYKNQPADGFTPIRRKDGQIVRYKCAACVMNSRKPLPQRDAYGRAKTQERESSAHRAKVEHARLIKKLKELGR